MSYIVTYTGKKFPLFNPTVDDVCIEDIAHALSLLCRFTGHCKRMYSVGLHSYLASVLVPKEHALEALLHDGTEAYLNDLSRPLKHDHRMEPYLHAEGTIDYVIRSKYGIPIVTTPPYMTQVVKDVDDKLVYTEGRQLMANAEWTTGHPVFDLVLPDMPHSDVEHLFLRRFKELYGGVK